MPAFVAHMSRRWHIWNNVGGALRPLATPRDTVDDPASQLWIRANADSPWVVDVPLTPDRDGRWTNKRVPGHIADVEDVTWVADDGIRYLRPEIVLVYKAALRRPKDDLDLEALRALLKETARTGFGL